MTRLEHPAIEPQFSIDISYVVRESAGRTPHQAKMPSEANTAGVRFLVFASFVHLATA